MKCPNCGLQHPTFYERCVGCGTDLKNSWSIRTIDPMKQSMARLRGLRQDQEEQQRQEELEEEPRAGQGEALHISPGNRELTGNKERSLRRQIPTKVGVTVALLILLICAGATAFFLSQSPNDKRLVEIGKHQLDLGQYAFAVETLNKAIALKSDDPQAFLALARAYLGIDQVDKAWDCIVHAQQLGVGVVADPALASQLANYYRQKGQYDKAVDLLRPLANASIPGKKAELADMDASRGDECIEKGDLEQAKRSWEEVRDIGEGSRAAESQARLATIYTRLADLAFANHEDDKAIDYLNKLNSIGENTNNYLMAAEVYERQGKLNEAIEQIRKGIKLSADNSYVQTRLAELLSKRGKELIDTGETESGYGYLEQAKAADPNLKMPVITLKTTTAAIDGESKKPVLSGEIWNPANKNVDTLNMNIELCDLSKGKIIWSRNERVIDEFTAALRPQETKAFRFLAPHVPEEGENLAFKVYLDGNFYQSYPLKSKLTTTAHEVSPKQTNKLDKQQGKGAEQKQLMTEEHPEDFLNQSPRKKAESPSSPSGKSRSPSASENLPPISPEEKTLRDLDY